MESVESIPTLGDAENSPSSADVEKNNGSSRKEFSNESGFSDSNDLNNKGDGEPTKEKSSDDFSSLFNGINETHQNLFDNIAKAKQYHNGLRDKISSFEVKIQEKEHDKSSLQKVFLEYSQKEMEDCEHLNIEDEANFTYNHVTVKNCRRISSIVSKIENGGVSLFEKNSALLDELSQKSKMLDDSFNYIKILKDLDRQKNIYKRLKEEEKNIGLRFQTLAEIFNLDHEINK